MVITRLADTENQPWGGDASAGMCCTLELALFLPGLDVPTRLLLMDAAWWQSGLSMCLVKYVGDLETFDPILLLAGGRGGSPR